MKSKIIVTVSACVVLCAMIIVCLVLIPFNDNKNENEDEKCGYVQSIIEYTDYDFEEDKVVVEQGDENIFLDYNPEDVKKDKFSAFEYSFTNESSTLMAVTLNDIAEEELVVSFVYSDVKLSKITNTSYPYKTQTVEVGKTKYIYLVLSVLDESTQGGFVVSPQWETGEAKQVIVKNNINESFINHVIIKDQTMDKSFAPIKKEGFYFDTWYLDEQYTIPATFPLDEQTTTLYVRFANLDQQYIDYDGEKYVVDFGVEGDVIIPSVFNDGINGTAYVTKIKEHAFSNKNITNLSLPYTIEEIGKSAFENSTIKCNVLMPKNLTKIDEACFRMSALTSIDLSNCRSLQIIGENAFYGCGELDEIDLSDCVALNKIEKSAFERCKNLVNVNLVGCESLVEIGESAFETTAIEEMFIPRSVNKISKYAFSGCVNLETIEFEDAENWYKVDNVTDWTNATNGEVVDVATATQNAEWFSIIIGYRDYYWYKLSA